MIMNNEFEGENLVYGRRNLVTFLSNIKGALSELVCSVQMPVGP